MVPRPANPAAADTRHGRPGNGNAPRASASVRIAQTTTPDVCPDKPLAARNRRMPDSFLALTQPARPLGLEVPSASADGTRLPRRVPITKTETDDPPARAALAAKTSPRP